MKKIVICEEENDGDMWRRWWHVKKEMVVTCEEGNDGEMQRRKHNNIKQDDREIKWLSLNTLI